MNEMVNHEDFVAFDTETGGLNAAECALLSIAAVPSWEAPPFSVHVLPVGRIDAKAAEVNGYTPELWAARGAVTPKVAMLEFQRWLHQTWMRRRLELEMPAWRFDMAAHNAGFDLLFLEAAQQRTGIFCNVPGVWHCTKILMQEVKEGAVCVAGWPKGNRLDDLGELSGFWDLEPRSQAHDALQDARCCGHGLKWLRGLKDGRKEAQKIQKEEGRNDG